MANKRKTMKKIIELTKHIENGLNNSEIKIHQTKFLYLYSEMLFCDERKLVSSNGN